MLRWLSRRSKYPAAFFLSVLGLPCSEFMIQSKRQRGMGSRQRREATVVSRTGPTGLVSVALRCSQRGPLTFYWTVNTRYEVLCSFAILLEITANLYVHRRRFTPFEKRASPQAAQATQAGNREAAQAAQAAQEENRQRWLRILKRRA